METIKMILLYWVEREFHSRFILGSGKFSQQLIRDVMEYGGSEIATIALRRANADSPENILDYLPKNLTLLPNTSGARNADEAVRIARLSRALGCGDFVKVEVIPDTKYLLPDNAETIRATEILSKEGFHVLPYMYPDSDRGTPSGRCRSCCDHAAGCSYWQQQGTAYQGFYPNPH